MRLTVLDHLPNGLLELAPAELYRVLSGPTLIHLPGRREQPLLVSTLLHGNEDTGFRALQSVLRRYRDQSLPRALSLFIGNVEAARYGLRKLDAQPDFNRVWLGGERRGYAEENVALEVLDQMQRRALFASIDVHNNTGRNPHYVCATHLEAPALHLATLFSRIVVYFTTPKGTQAEAFGSLCPAVTVECGKPGVTGGELHAAEYIEACLHLSALPAHPVPPQDIDLFHTVAVVKVRDEVSFSFGGGEAGAIFDAEIDRFNFCELTPGTCFGLSRVPAPLRACDEAGRDVTADFFDVREGRIVLRRTVMPAMLTLEERIIRQDCFCYLMERLSP